MLESVEWGEFKVGDLFEILSSKNIYHANEIDKIFDNQVSNSYPYVVRTTQNNGIRGYIIEDKLYANDENTLSFAQDTFSVFYQKQKYFTGNKVKVLKAKFDNQNERIMQYLTASFQKALTTFTWGIGSTIETISKTKIQLPIKNNKIDFDFMDSFIAGLEAERIAELEAYLVATGLKDYVLSDEEERVLREFESMEWVEFRLGGLFEKLNLRNHNKSFEKLQDTSTTRTNEFNLPLVNAKLGNNGIMFYGREKDFDSAEMTIDIISNGAVATGTVYAQPHKTGVLWDAYLLKPISNNMSKENLLYLATTLQKSIKTKFGWEDKAVWSKVQYEMISLPTQNNQPDYQTMQTLIRAIQKLVIKDVVLYADRKIEATKSVVNQ